MKTRDLSLRETAAFLAERDHYIVLTHSSPDGDTLGAAFGLCGLLAAMGKEAAVVNGDTVPPKFGYLGICAAPPDPAGKTVIAVDIADRKLAKGIPEPLLDATVLSLDHHPSHVRFAPLLLLEPNAAACSETVARLIPFLGIEPTPAVATALYTGIATDTGCFQFTNTSAETHRIAAALMEWGADAATVNRVMFETRTKGRIYLDSVAMRNMEYAFGGLCALTRLSYEDIHADGIDPDELTGVSSLPRTVEGVLIGLTLKEKEKNVYSVSARSFEPVDASAICAGLGGGGHVRAAGCEIEGDFETVKRLLLAGTERELKRSGVIA